jgi:hypothetical protein
MADADNFSAVAASIDLLLSQLKSPNSVEDAEKILAAAKTASEIRKLEAERIKAEQEAEKAKTDRQIAPRQLRYSFLGIIFGTLVPIASLGTVIVSLYNTREQTRLTLEQTIEKAEQDAAARNETRWEAFEDKLDSAKGAEVLYSSPTFVARLRQFARDSRHSDDLREISKRLMLGLETSFPAFQDIWNLQIKDVTADSLQTAIELAKGAKSKNDQVVDDCKLITTLKPLTGDPIWTSYFGVCSPQSSNDDIRSVLDKSQLEQAMKLRGLRNDTASVQTLVSLKLSDYLRKNYSTRDGAADIDLSSITFVNSDLDGVNFGKANLLQAVFDRTTLNGANLATDSFTYDFRGSTWWDAAVINQTVLPWLIGNNYPYSLGEVLPQNYVVSLDQYKNDIERLCTSKMPICRPECLRFGAAAPPSPPECVQK